MQQVAPDIWHCADKSSITSLQKKPAAAIPQR